MLVGTTNPSKIRKFKKLLSDYDIEICTPEDLNILEEPEERGRTPEENAVLKARFYGQYFDAVICNDSGLYFAGLDLHDERQPGLNIRTPGRCKKRLDDEEMIEYYSGLVHELGGKVPAYYLDGIAVYHQGKISSWMENEKAEEDSFYMVDKPSGKRQEGWPLNSLSLDRDKGLYFVDDEYTENSAQDEDGTEGEYERRMVRFLVEALLGTGYY